VYPKPISVSYKHIFELTPRLYEEYADVKFFVHVGLHSKINGYRLEKRAIKGPYSRKDEEGQSFEPTTEEEIARWESAREELWTDIDVDGIVGTMKAEQKVESELNMLIGWLTFL